MGCQSKAFERLHGTGFKPVAKTKPDFKSASLFGGLIRKREPVTPAERPLKKSVGELGQVTKAKDAGGHGSWKRDATAPIPDYTNGTHRAWKSSAGSWKLRRIGSANMVDSEHASLDEAKSAAALSVDK